MLVETSALVAVLLEEPEADDILGTIAAAKAPETTVVNAFEATLSVGRVLEDYGLAGRLVPDLLESSDIRVIGVGPEIYSDMVTAYAKYGKGTGHFAQLNFGDCFSYAAAKRAGVRLLYVGEDFARTDLA